MGAMPIGQPLLYDQQRGHWHGYCGDCAPVTMLAQPAACPFGLCRVRYGSVLALRLHRVPPGR
jgi:hypothetical protein